MAKRTHPGLRLRRFRDARDISLRGAARQLDVSHPALKGWEQGEQIPSLPNRQAIEVWTNGEIKADSWPLGPHERAVAAHVKRVAPAVSKAPKTAESPHAS